MNCRVNILIAASGCALVPLCGCAGEYVAAGTYRCNEPFPIMTFIVGPDGAVYQRDLGKNTDRVAASMKEFNPTKKWAVVLKEGLKEWQTASVVREQ